MRVLVAGATGVVGRALVPELVCRGHVVGGLARDPLIVRKLGGEPLMADVLDREAVRWAFATFRPDAVIHQLTALRESSIWRFDRAFAQTDRLRTDGTDILLEAARSVGVTRFIAQSFCGWPAARTGGPIKSENAPFDDDPPKQFRATLDAIRYLERVVGEATDVNGVILRYGSFYGPGTHLARGGILAEQVRRRRMPIVGDGLGVWSFVHIGDVARATAVAVEGNMCGVFNVVDDEPAPVAGWLPNLASVMKAPAPRHMPLRLAKIVLPKHLQILMTEARGGSNALFKETFDWRPAVPSWRRGF